MSKCHVGSCCLLSSLTFCSQMEMMCCLMFSDFCIEQAWCLFGFYYNSWVSLRMSEIFQLSDHPVAFDCRRTMIMWLWCVGLQECVGSTSLRTVSHCPQYRYRRCRAGVKGVKILSLVKSDSFLYMYCCMHVWYCNTVRWTWWDSSLSLRLLLPSVLWHCRLGHLTRKTPPRYDLQCV